MGQLDGQTTGDESVAAGGDRRYEARQWCIDRHLVQTRVPRRREVVGPSRSDEREHERDGRRAVRPHRGVTFRFESHDLVVRSERIRRIGRAVAVRRREQLGGPRQLPETIEGQLQPSVGTAVGVLRAPRVRREHRPITPCGQLGESVLGQGQPQGAVLGEPACEHQRRQLDRVADTEYSERSAPGHGRSVARRDRGDELAHRANTATPQGLELGRKRFREQVDVGGVDVVPRARAVLRVVDVPGRVRADEATRAFQQVGEHRRVGLQAEPLARDLASREHRRIVRGEALVEERDPLCRVTGGREVLSPGLVGPAHQWVVVERTEAGERLGHAVREEGVGSGTVDGQEHLGQRVFDADVGDLARAACVEEPEGEGEVGAHIRTNRKAGEHAGQFEIRCVSDREGGEVVDDRLPQIDGQRRGRRRGRCGHQRTVAAAACLPYAVTTVRHNSSGSSTTWSRSCSAGSILPVRTSCSAVQSRRPCQ